VVQRGQHRRLDRPVGVYAALPAAGAQHDGWIDVPRKPGLGVEVRESVLAKYKLS
jgi:L-alanine-DL-glutamate epimerase-like enolase superfamily enzyme